MEYISVVCMILEHSLALFLNRLVFIDYPGEDGLYLLILRNIVPAFSCIT